MARVNPAVLTITALRVARNATFTLEVPRLRINSGQVTCVVGANGCGKTTLLEAVTGLLVPVSGSVRIKGQDYSYKGDDIALRCLLGFIPDDENWLIPELTANEYLALLSSIYRRAGISHDTLADAERVLDELHFTQRAVQLGTLSHGNRKKVQIAAGLMHNPALIVVDELRNGLDPIAIMDAEQLLKRRAKAGAAVLAATHDLWWAERFAGTVMMLKNGQVILQAPTRSIVRAAGSVEARFMQLYAEPARV